MRTNEDLVKAASSNVPDDCNFFTTQPEGLRSNCEAVEVLNVNTPMQAIFTQVIELVLVENQRVLQAIAYRAVEQLAQKITDVERIFVIGSRS